MLSCSIRLNGYNQVLLQSNSPHISKRDSGDFVLLGFQLNCPGYSVARFTSL